MVVEIIKAIIFGIVEGITEEILLPVFANKLGVNFDEKGILNPGISYDA